MLPLVLRGDQRGLANLGFGQHSPRKRNEEIPCREKKQSNNDSSRNDCLPINA